MFTDGRSAFWTRPPHCETGVEREKRDSLALLTTGEYSLGSHENYISPFLCGTVRGSRTTLLT